MHSTITIGGLERFHVAGRKVWIPGMQRQKGIADTQFYG